MGAYLLYVPIEATPKTDSKTSKIGTFVSSSSRNALDWSAQLVTHIPNKGVSRQWPGRLGKVDDGQVAVFGVLAKDYYAVPVDVRLYLPKNWTDDPKRCKFIDLHSQPVHT